MVDGLQNNVDTPFSTVDVRLGVGGRLPGPRSKATPSLWENGMVDGLQNNVDTPFSQKICNREGVLGG
jgi:hypothetical protein